VKYKQRERASLCLLFERHKAVGSNIATLWLAAKGGKVGYSLAGFCLSACINQLKP